MSIELQTKGKSVIMRFTSDSDKRGYYRAILDDNEALYILNKIEKHLNGINKIEKVIPEDKAYNEEISTYSKDVERSLFIGKDMNGNMKLSLICYTDKNDDNWIELSVKRAAKLASLMHGYIINQ